jgi:superfamily II DNA or RNA helicase
VRAEYVDGETPNDDRAAIFRRVESGETEVLVNVFVASYGLDIPPLACCVIARPTKSLVLYLQMAGRILRPLYADGFDLDTTDGRLASIANSTKPYSMIIDHSGCVKRHGFIDDFIPWSLDGDENISDAKERVAQEKAAPKELTCPKCYAVFKGSRFCPACGFEFVPPGEAVPTYRADLREIIREGTEANRKTPWEDKIEFMAQARGYAASKGYKEGFAAHLYRSKFGVFPNDARVHHVPGKAPGDLVKGFVKHLAIKKHFRESRG